MQQVFGKNPSSQLAHGISQGFQRNVLTNEPAHVRDWIRVSFSGTTPSAQFEPLERQGLKTFRPNAVTCCLEMAAVNRTSNAPVLVHISPFQTNSVSMAAAGTGPSISYDNTIGVVTPNMGNTYQPQPNSSGAQFSTSNILDQQISVAFTDAANNLITDLSSFYISLVFFERIL